MKRSTLVIASIAVLAAVVVLYLKLRGGPEATSSPSGATTVSTGDPTPATMSSAQDRPTLPTTPTGSAAAWGSGDGSSYTLGNVTVRDHRKGNHKPLDIPPNMTPPDGRKVASTLVAELSAKIRGILTDCTGGIPPEARGAKPRMEGQITIAIKDHVVAVQSSVIQIRDVLGASVDPTRQCIEKKALEITHPAPDEKDVEAYQINLTFALL